MWKIILKDFERIRIEYPISKSPFDFECTKDTIIIDHPIPEDIKEIAKQTGLIFNEEKNVSFKPFKYEKVSDGTMRPLKSFFFIERLKECVNPKSIEDIKELRRVDIANFEQLRKYGRWYSNFIFKVILQPKLFTDGTSVRIIFTCMQMCFEEKSIRRTWKNISSQGIQESLEKAFDNFELNSFTN